ncbi:FxLD family lanthipeptide [Bailinhaonella thermotolerans]|uniref:FxLD family lantipeptide n=1 Tax=Bailinhaonella thermotolerans TaxID=1070861 RepID=A0A3A4APJ0_9ACTN|nr:FxLD family lanthipeptide [Bailinhaonella thermotolerans]RJL23188.1 FxLD family lantipeptide [Bailinhaonella thermotolerans]
MSPLTLDVPAQEPPATEDPYALDLAIVEATTPLPMLMCDTSNGCGSTCSTSACSTSANDPV